MKQKDISIYSNLELQQIRKNLILSFYKELPVSIKEYLEKEKLIGSKTTRSMRVIHLIDVEIIERFMKKDLSSIVPESNIDWVQKRVDFLNLKYDEAIDVDVKKMYGARLKSYKEVLDYLKTR